MCKGFVYMNWIGPTLILNVCYMNKESFWWKQKTLIYWVVRSIDELKYYYFADSSD